MFGYLPPFRHSLTRKFYRPYFLLALSLLASGLILARALAWPIGPEAVIPARALKEQTRPGDRRGIQSAQRGSPYISLSDGREVSTAYDGPSELVRALDRGEANPSSLASADFDEDGVADLVAGYASASGAGILVLHRGNADSIYPDSHGAQERKRKGTFTDSPFLSPALVFGAPEAVDFAGAGDFDGDGHSDIAVATRTADRLYLLSGDGRGGLSVSKTIALQGNVTALAAGEMNRRDGLPDLAVAVNGATGAKVLVFEGPDGAFDLEPEVFDAPAEVTSLALGQLDDNLSPDLAVAAGHRLMIIHGRDRNLSPGDEKQSDAPAAFVEARAFTSRIDSLATGHFTGDNHDEIALAFEDGQIKVLSDTSGGGMQAASVKQGERAVLRDPSDARAASETVAPLRRPDTSRSASEGPPKGSRPIETWSDKHLTRSEGINGARLTPIHVSSAPVDNLLVTGTATGKMKVVVAGQKENRHLLKTADINDETIEATLEANDHVAAVLPMRLNKDALSDFVVMKEGRATPTVVQTTPQAIFAVSNTADSGPNSLRDLITQANNSPGPDEIRFAISGSGAQTISLSSPLPAITGALTIDGYSQQGAAQNGLATGTNAVLLIELNGAGAGAANGLNITGGSCVVRGLIINRFSQAGIRMTGGGFNKIEGNYVGVSSTGTTKLGNQADGISISSSDNTIGGTSPSARNVISGNVANGILVSGARNAVSGNHVGINPAGSAVLGNGNNGMLLQNDASTTVGGPSSLARNTIGGNAGFGLELKQSQAYLIQENNVGTTSNGSLNLGNVKDGIRIGGSSNNGTVRDAVVGFNAGFGIKKSISASATLRPNVRIFSNTGGGLGFFQDSIFVGFVPGVTIFSNCFSLTGLGITSATVSGNMMTVRGFLYDSARRNKAITVDLYSGAVNPAGDQFIGNLPLYLGSVTTTTNNDGLAGFTSAPITLQSGSSGHWVNAQATSENSTFDKSNFLQTASGCSYVVSPSTNPAVIPAAGGSGSFQIQTQSNCTWKVFYDSCVVSSVNASSGAGPTTVTYQLFANSFPVARRITFVVQGQLHVVNQAAAPTGAATCPKMPISIGETINGSITDADCNAPHGLDFKADLYTFNAMAGQILAIRMEKLSTSIDPYLILTDPSGAVVAVNDDIDPGKIQSSQIVYQVPKSGAYTIEASTYDPADRGSYSLSVAQNVCTPAPIVFGQTVTGNISEGDCNDAAGYKADLYRFNASAGQTINVTMSKLSSTIDPYLLLIGPDGLVITSDDDSAGDQNSRIIYTIPANGTYTVEASTYNLFDRGAYSLSLAFNISCDFSINPSGASVGPASGAGSFTVTVQSGCNWTAVSSDTTWLSTSSSGSGNGTVSYSFTQNTSTSLRSATITVGGQSYGVTQSGATVCNFILNPTGASFGANGGGSSFSVFVQNNCNWTAVSSDTSWLTTSSSGTGNGTVSYFFTQNTSTSTRSAVISVGGQSHFVTQAGAPVLQITFVAKEGKHFYITGSGFMAGATVVVNDQDKKTRVDSSTSIFSKKGAKGVTFPARIKIRQNGSESNTYIFQQP